jgi:hypothetical protein
MQSASATLTEWYNPGDSHQETSLSAMIVSLSDGGGSISHQLLGGKRQVIGTAWSIDHRWSCAIYADARTHSTTG